MLGSLYIVSPQSRLCNVLEAQTVKVLIFYTVNESYLHVLLDFSHVAMPCH